MINITDDFFSSFFDFFNFFYFPAIGITDCIEIFIIVFIIYQVITKTKDTRTWTVLKGILFFFIFYIISCVFSFSVIEFLFENIVVFLAFAVIALFQPELRRLIENLGNKSIIKTCFFFKKKNSIHENFSDKTLDELTKTAFLLGKAKTGALIVIEKQTPLNEYISTGISVNGEISSPLLINIFEKNTPLHDGAVIIKNNEIVSATCYLPLSKNQQIDKSLGTRHRAGIGINEVIDCFVIIVSEETGAVSIVRNGELLENVSEATFTKELRILQTQDYGTVKINSVAFKPMFFKKNILKKIAAVALGCLFWLVIINVTNPIVSKTFTNIPVSVTNEETLSAMSKTYQIDGTDNISVTLKGHRSILDAMTEKDIKASVDVSKLSSINTTDINIYTGKSLDVVSLSNKTITVNIDDLSQSEWPVDITTTGKAKSGYYLNKISLNNETILVSGAKKLLAKIGEVKVSVDITDKNNNSSLDVVPVIYDKNGDIIDNSKFSFNVEKIKATILLYKTKSIKLNIKATDDKDTQGTITDVTYQPKTITIAANDNILSKLNNIDIIIPVKIDISNNDNTQLVKTINITDYLSDDLLLADENKKITITVTFEPFEKKEVSIKTSEIKSLNLESQFNVNFNADSFKAVIIAPKDKISKIKEKDIIAQFNFKEYKEGTYEIIPELSLDGYFITTSSKITCIIDR